MVDIKIKLLLMFLFVLFQQLKLQKCHLAFDDIVLINEIIKLFQIKKLFDTSVSAYVYCIVVYKAVAPNDEEHTIYIYI